MARWRKVLVLAVLVAGIGGSIASSSEPEGGDGGNGGGGGGGGTATTAASDARGEPDQVDDVTLGECTKEPTLNFMEGTVSVTNDSSDASDYLIEVAFQSEDGATLYGTGNAIVSGLAAGQTTTADVTSLDEAPAEPFECELTSVIRTAAL